MVSRRARSSAGLGAGLPAAPGGLAVAAVLATLAAEEVQRCFHRDAMHPGAGGSINVGRINRWSKAFGAAFEIGEGFLRCVLCQMHVAADPVGGTGDLLVHDLTQVVPGGVIASRASMQEFVQAAAHTFFAATTGFVTNYFPIAVTLSQGRAYLLLLMKALALEIVASQPWQAARQHVPHYNMHCPDDRHQCPCGSQRGRQQQRYR